MSCKLKPVLLNLMLCSCLPAWAQTDDLAYVPREVPERTADDGTIDLIRTPEPGIVDLQLPVGTNSADLLNAAGNVVLTLDLSIPPRLDLKTLRQGTWTIRAHTSDGARVRRFLVLGNNSTMWTGQKKTRTR